TCLSFDENIYPKINRLAENKEGITTVARNKKKYYDRLYYIINKLNDKSLEKDIEKDKLTIQNIKLMYDNLKKYFSIKTGFFYDRVYSIFDYNDFTKEKEDWYAYKLTQQLGINVCPYCNRNYIHTSISKNGRTRAELDHY